MQPEIKHLTGADPVVSEPKPLSAELRETLVVGLHLMTIIQIASRAAEGKLFTAAKQDEGDETWRGLIVERYPGDAEGTGMIAHRTSGTYATEQGALTAAQQIIQACSEEMAERQASAKAEEEDETEEFSPAIVTAEEIRTGRLAFSLELIEQISAVLKLDRLAAAGMPHEASGQFIPMVVEDLGDNVRPIIVCNFVHADQEAAKRIAEAIAQQAVQLIETL